MSSRYTDEQFIEAWNVSRSLREVLIRINIAPQGGSYYTCRRVATRLGLSTDVLDTNKKNRPLGVARKSASGVWTKRKLRVYLLNTYGDQCCVCGTSEWQGKKLSLHLDHIDGNHANNERSNGRLLCPNCHSQTSTYTGKNLTNPSRNKNSGRDYENLLLRESIPARGDSLCEVCGRKISYKATHCKKCVKKETKIQWPDRAQVQMMVEATSYTATGRKLGVTDNAIRKYLRRTSKFVV